MSKTAFAGKYISLLLRSNDRYAYRHILAVTFTNKATDEMKNRILKELHVLATNPSNSGYRKNFVPSVFPTDAELSRKAESVLHDILHDYSAFAVSTIDKFFQQTLKAFSREIGNGASRYGKQYFLSPKGINTIVKNGAKIIGGGINQAFGVCYF